MIVNPANRLDNIQEYYFSRKLQEVRTLVAGGKDVINLGVGSPDLPPSEEVINTLRESALAPDANGYQPYRGIENLRKAIQTYYQQIYTVRLDHNEEILPLMGSKEGIFHISMAFLNNGDEVLVPNPGYPGYNGATKLAGATIREYELYEDNDWFPDIEALSKQNLNNVKIMWINYPHMPTGATASLEKFEELVRFSQQQGFLLCNDNPYSRILNPTPISLFNVDGAIENCLELNSLSKSHHMPGWRVGLLAGRKDYLDTVLKVKSNIDSGMYRPVQSAAVTALEQTEDWHLQQNAIYQKRREMALKIVDLLDAEAQQKAAGLFVWARTSAAVESVEEYLNDLLYQVGIFMAPGFVFGSNGERYFRISLCAPDHKMTEAIHRIQSIL